MEKVIIYNQDNGVPAVVFPAPEELTHRTLEEIAQKSVPTGKPYAIIPASDLPSDTPQELWQVNDEDLTDGVGA